jgi:hypothetical protein
MKKLLFASLFGLCVANVGLAETLVTSALPNDQFTYLAKLTPEAWGEITSNDVVAAIFPISREKAELYLIAKKSDTAAKSTSDTIRFLDSQRDILTDAMLVAAAPIGKIKNGLYKGYFTFEAPFDPRLEGYMQQVENNDRINVTAIGLAGFNTLKGNEKLKAKVVPGPEIGRKAGFYVILDVGSVLKK